MPGRLRRTLPPNLHSHEYGGIQPPHYLILLPAYTVLPFLRAPLGYDLLRPGLAIRRTLQLVILPVVIEAVWVGIIGRPLPANMGHLYLVGFAVAYLVLTLVHFARRWLGQARDRPVHTAEAGYSWLARLTPLPVWLCELILTPLLLIAAGYLLIGNVSTELGWWLEASGTSLLLMGLWEHRRTWSQRRATTDDVIRAQAFEARVDRAAPAVAPTRQSDGPDFADLA